MKSKQLTRRATHLVATKLTDNLGGTFVEYLLGGDFWCEATFSSSNQFDDLGRVGVRTALTLVVRIETANQISVDDRIKYKGKDYAIVGILPDAEEVYASINLDLI